VLAALVVTLAVAVLATVVRSFAAVRGIGLAVIAPVAAAAVFPFLPDFIANRFTRLMTMLEGGPVEQNVIGRVDRWRYYLETVQPVHPFGTWVQPTFVGGMTPDSYLVTTLIQGTVVYSLLFVACVSAVLVLGLWAMDARFDPVTRASGLHLTALAAFIGIAALGGSVMFDPTVSVVVWTAVGTLLASIRGCRASVSSRPTFIDEPPREPPRRERGTLTA
jgi:hypothetical protein